MLPRPRSTPRVLTPLADGTAGDGDDHATALERHDRALIEVGLAQCRGNFSKTAGLLGISRATLRSRIVRYGLTAAFRDEDDAGLEALGEDDRKALGWLRARAWWAEHRSLPVSQQLARIETVHALRRRELFEAVLEEAAASAASDPRRGEETASVAYALAGLLPMSSCPVPVKHDLMASARWVAGNCRRLRGDWQGSAAAFEAARSHLDRGTSDPSREARLLSLEASLATDMGRHAEALTLVSGQSDLQLTYLEALVLDSLGRERQAEAVFRANVAARMEAGLYKDAHLTLPTRVELRFRRGELDKAALACEEAIAALTEDGEDRHAQAIDLFRELLALLTDRSLTEPRLLETQHALLRCWAAPDKAASPEPASRQGRTFVAPELPPVPARLAPGDYDVMMERYEREVILAGLAQAGGSLSEACRLLGISKNTLRERMSRYRLRETAVQPGDMGNA